MSSKPKSSSFRTRSFKQLFKRHSSRKKSLGRKDSGVADTEKHVSWLSIDLTGGWHHGVHLLAQTSTCSFMAHHFG